MLNFDQRHEVSAKSKRKPVNHLVVTLRLASVFDLSFRLGLGLLFMFP